MSQIPQSEGNRERYTVVAITLHWVMALGILALALVGLLMVHGHLGLSRKYALYQLHKSIGVTILLAALLRLAWRYNHAPPPLPAHMPRHERLAAHAGHWTLYFFLVALPLSGWALVSASVLNLPTHLYGVIPWPHLPVLSTLSDKAPVEAALKVMHRYGAWTLLVLVAGHASAALRHHFVNRDDVLRRMLPRPRHSAPHHYFGCNGDDSMNPHSFVSAPLASTIPPMFATPMDSTAGVQPGQCVQGQEVDHE